MVARITWSDLVIGYGRNAIGGPYGGEIAGGVLSVVTGPNGCGKTTFLRTLLGLLRPVAGTVRLVPEGLRAYVPQADALDASFPVTVEEVVELGFARRGRRSEHLASVRAALERVAMLEHRNRSYFRLSGGQRQRVLVARAIAADARLLALDEPTSGVDAESSERIWALLRELAREPERIVIVVSHDGFAVRRFAERQLVFEGGLLAELAGAAGGGPPRA